jgi:hypothetical protein
MTHIFQWTRKVRAPHAFALFLCALAVFASANTASAQEQTGTIRGTIINNQGTPVAGALVSATDVDRNIVLRGHTDKNGDFDLTAIVAGRYKVTAEAEGYMKVDSYTFRVTNHQGNRVDFQLKVASSPVSPTTDYHPSVLQTESSEVSTSISGDALASLPRH